MNPLVVGRGQQQHRQRRGDRNARASPAAGNRRSLAPGGRGLSGSRPGPPPRTGKAVSAPERSRPFASTSTKTRSYEAEERWSRPNALVAVSSSTPWALPSTHAARRRLRPPCRSERHRASGSRLRGPHRPGRCRLARRCRRGRCRPGRVPPGRCRRAPVQAERRGGAGATPTSARAPARDASDGRRSRRGTHRARRAEVLEEVDDAGARRRSTSADAAEISAAIRPRAA